jgi:hypothetical protein
LLGGSNATVTGHQRMSFEHVPKPTHIDTSFRPGGMIGMLDYRASKLYRLLAFPVKLASIALELVIIVICVLVTGQWSATLANRVAGHGADIYLVTMIFHIVMGAIVATTSLTVLSLLWSIGVLWIFNKAFLFFIDVVPSEGRSYPQALSVLQYGDMARLTLKMEYPETWTDSDTNEYVKRLSLIVRLMYGDRIRSRLPGMIAILYKAKQEGVNLSADTFEIKSRLKPLTDTISKEEKFVSSRPIRSAVWLIAIFTACLIMYYR